MFPNIVVMNLSIFYYLHHVSVLFLLRRALVDKDERTRARARPRARVQSMGPSMDVGKAVGGVGGGVGVRTDVRVGIQSHGNVDEEVDLDVTINGDDDSGDDDDDDDDGMSSAEVMRVGRGLAHVPVQLAHLAIDGTCFLFLVLSG